MYYNIDGLNLPSTRDCTSLNFKVYMYRPKYNTALTSARERVAVVGRFYAWGTTLRRRQRPRVSKRKAEVGRTSRAFNPRAISASNLFLKSLKTYIKKQNTPLNYVKNTTTKTLHQNVAFCPWNPVGGSRRALHDEGHPARMACGMPADSREVPRALRGLESHLRLRE